MHLFFIFDLDPSIKSGRNTQSLMRALAGACTSNPCKHGGLCIPKGPMTYECKCTDPWRGIDCDVGRSDPLTEHER